MSKITLNSIADLTQSSTAQTTINTNSSTVQTAFDNTLSRDGTSPNTMGAALDMNSNQIINLPAPSTVNSPARLIDVTSNPTIVVPGTGTSGHVVPFLDGNNTFSGTDTFNGNVTLSGTNTIAGFSSTATSLAANNTWSGANTFTGTTTLPLATVRKRLSAPITYFVSSSTGSNANNGLTSGTPFLTIQFAVNTINSTLDLAGNNCTVQLADGTYNEAVNLMPYLGRAGQGHTGPVLIQGNTSTPSNVIVNGGAGTCFTAASSQSCEWDIKALKLVSTSGNGVISDAGGWIVLDNVVFGTCGNIHMQAENGGIIEIVSNYTINGPALLHILATGVAQVIYAAGLTITVTGTPAFSSFFVASQDNSRVQASGLTFSGSATGVRISAINGGGINTASGASATYFPGNSAGSATSPGWYV